MAGRSFARTLGKTSCGRRDTTDSQLDCYCNHSIDRLVRNATRTTVGQEIEVNVGGRLNSSTESPRQTLELMADNGAMGVETRITDSGRRIVGRGISELSWKMPVNSSDQSFSSTWYAQ